MTNNEAMDIGQRGLQDLAKAGHIHITGLAAWQGGFQVYKWKATVRLPDGITTRVDLEDVRKASVSIGASLTGNDVSHSLRVCNTIMQVAIFGSIKHPI